MPGLGARLVEATRIVLVGLGARLADRHHAAQLVDGDHGAQTHCDPRERDHLDR